MRGFLGAVAFLTRVRLPASAHPRDATEVGAAVGWFGVVGLALGLVGAAVLAAAHPLVGPLLGAVVVVAVLVVLTGALHEDGLADCCDAFAGASSRERRLEILKDSRQGTFGVLALVVVVAWRVGALAGLDAWQGAAALVVTQALGRVGATVAMVTQPAATTAGLGGRSAAAAAPTRVGAGAVVVVAALAGAVGPLATATALGAGALAAVVTLAWARSRIGGITGDVLGAVAVTTECAALAALAALAHHDTVPLPWW